MELAPLDLQEVSRRKPVGEAALAVGLVLLQQLGEVIAHLVLHDDAIDATHL